MIKVGPVKNLETNVNSTHNELQTTTTHVMMPSRKRIQPQIKSKFSYLLLMFNILKFLNVLTFYK